MAANGYDRLPLFGQAPIQAIEHRSTEHGVVVDVTEPDGRTFTLARSEFDARFAVLASSPKSALARDTAVVRTDTPSSGAVRISARGEPVVPVSAPLSAQAAAIGPLAEEADHAAHIAEEARKILRASVVSVAEYIDAAAATAMLTCAAAPAPKRAEAVNAACARAAVDWAPSVFADRFCRDTGIPRSLWKPVRSYETSSAANIASMMDRYAGADLASRIDHAVVMVLNREVEDVVAAAEIWLEGTDLLSTQAEDGEQVDADTPQWALDWRRAWFGDGRWSSAHRRFGIHDILVFEMSDMLHVMAWPTEAPRQAAPRGLDENAPYLSGPCYSLDIDAEAPGGLLEAGLIAEEGFGTPVRLPWDRFLREFRPFPARVERWVRVQPTKWLDACTANVEAGLVRADRWGRPTIPCALPLAAQMFTLRNLGLDDNHIGHILAEGDARLLDADTPEGQLVDALLAATVANADDEDFASEEALEELIDRNQERLREEISARCRGQAPRVVARSLGIPPHAWRSKRGMPEREMVAMLLAARDLFGPWETKIVDEPGALTVDAEHAGPLKDWLVSGEMVGTRPTPKGDLIGVRREGCDFLWTEAGGDLIVYGWRSPPQGGAPDHVVLN
jgi:hypothetical protein